MEVPMIVRLSAGLAAPGLAAPVLALCLLTAPVFAQGAKPGAKPTDPQIAHIAYTAGQLDIDAAKQALSKSKNKEVRSFAEDMVRDHHLLVDDVVGARLAVVLVQRAHPLLADRASRVEVAREVAHQLLGEVD